MLDDAEVGMVGEMGAIHSAMEDGRVLMCVKLEERLLVGSLAREVKLRASAVKVIEQAMIKATADVRATTWFLSVALCRLRLSLLFCFMIIGLALFILSCVCILCRCVNVDMYRLLVAIDEAVLRIDSSSQWS